MNTKKLTALELAALTDIAKEHLGFETLQTRKIGSQDFREVAVWCLKDALEAAYRAGAQSATPWPHKGARKASKAKIKVTLPVANPHFAQYVRGYLGDDYDAMNVGWDAFKAEVGDQAALKQFWSWQATLPARDRSDCDPDGN